MSKKYSLVIAIHRGTPTSRDVGEPKEFDTQDEALQEFYSAKKFFKRVAYQIWYATLTDPEGNKSTLEQNPYR